MRRNKIITGKNYGSIPHLLDSSLGKHDKFLHEGQDQIIRKGGRDKHDRVIVTLKLDGTNVGVVKKDGQIIAIQRKGYDCASSPYRQHHEFDKWVHENHARFDSLLHEGDRVAGEWLWQASGIKYRIEGEPFFAFDYFPYYGGRMSYDAMLEFIGKEEKPLRTVPLIADTAKHHINTVRIGQQLVLIHPGLLAQGFPVKAVEGLHEGLVYRVERKGVLDFMGKWVRPDFIPGRFLPGLNGNPDDADIILNTLTKIK